MRQFPHWGYWLFVVAFAAGCIAFFRDFVGAAVMFSFLLSPAIYRHIIQHGLKRWLIPYGFVFALLLGSLYYIADLLIFPHSPRAAHRLQDAYSMGLIFAFWGFLTAAWSPAGKRIAQDHAMNGTAIERRR